MIRQLEESVINSSTPSLTSTLLSDTNKSLPLSNEITQKTIINDNTSEIYFLDNNNCFNNLIQYDLQPHDPEEVGLNKLYRILNLMSNICVFF